MTPAPFEVPRLKLRRALHHIDDLEAQISAYLSRDPLYAEVVADPTFLGGTKLVVRVREEVPVDFAFIIGDALHNLRASLDLLACEVVHANGGSDEKVYFPFARSATDLPSVIRHRHIDRAKPGVAAALMNKWHPYCGGNEQLRAIHDLDIMDKHQALIPTLGMVGPAAPDPTQVRRMGPVRDGMAIVVPEAHAALPIGHHLPGDFSLNFPLLSPTGGEVHPLTGGEVIQTLRQLANLVNCLIEDLILAAT
jgi:hypothetical protein